MLYAMHYDARSQRVRIISDKADEPTAEAGRRRWAELVDQRRNTDSLSQGDLESAPAQREAPGQQAEPGPWASTLDPVPREAFSCSLECESSPDVARPNRTVIPAA